MMLATLARAAAGAVAFVMAVLSAWFLGRRDGARTTTSRIAEEDKKNAQQIEKRADAARAVADDPVRRLHKAGRLRD